MPILYESTDAVVAPLSIAPTKPSTRTRRTGRLQPAEAPKWEVTQEWAMNGIYLTVDNAFGIVKTNVISACQQKSVSLESIWIEDAWAIWKGFWTEYHMVVKYIIAPLPTTLAGPLISYAVVAALIALAAIGIIIVIGIWLVSSTVQAIFEWVPPEVKPIVATALLLGVSAVAIGGGIWALTKVLPKKPGPAPPPPPAPMYR